MTGYVLDVAVCFFQQFWNLKSFPQVLKGCRAYIILSQYKPWWDFFPSLFQNLTMSLKRHRKPDLLHSPLYLLTSVCRERGWCIIFILVSASVSLVRYFLFFSGNLFLLPVREVVWKGKFYLRSCASTLPQIWYSLLSLNQLTASKQGQQPFVVFPCSLAPLRVALFFRFPQGALRLPAWRRSQYLQCLSSISAPPPCIEHSWLIPVLWVVVWEGRHFGLGTRSWRGTGDFMRPVYILSQAGRYGWGGSGCSCWRVRVCWGIIEGCALSKSKCGDIGLQ